MSFYKRAFRYVTRKKSKSILLIACFLVISTMILCATMILQTAQATNMSIQEKTGTKLILENQRGENGISSELLSDFSNLPLVNKINRVANNIAYPVEFSPVIKNDGIEPLNRAVMLQAYDNTETDGLFSQDKYRLLDGKHITDTENGIIINSILAETNGLKVGDKLSFQNENGKIAVGKIVGIFFSGSERKQENNITAAYRIENQIFVNHKLFEELYGTIGYSSASVYTSSPEQLAELREQIEPLIDDTTSVSSSDTLYKQLQAPLKQVIRITTLMLALIIITAVIVISLLLCMWTRTRIKETAVLISLGVSKLNLLLQELTESFSLFVISVLGATVISSIFSTKIMSVLFSVNDYSSIANAHLQTEHILSLFLVGGAIVVIAVSISIFPILRSNPRDTLSRMEG